MSSGTTPPLSLPPETTVVALPTSDRERFIDQRLRQTRRQVRGVDIAAGLVVLAIGALSYLFAAAILDQWVITGGLGYWSRLLLWCGLVAGAGVYFARHLVAPLMYRINPVFAAATIEEHVPSLRNSLVNFLLLRGHRQEVAWPVLQAMERRAADDLSHVRIEVAVDRTHLVRLSFALAAIIAVLGLYLVVSPKNPFRSAARILWPWSTVEAPTRVTVHDVQPGDAKVFHGDAVTISAEIAGLREGELPAIVYRTADGQTVDQSLPMTAVEGGFRYQCRFPPGNLGLQQNCEYRIAAGDCRSRVFQLAVQVAPAIDIEKITYHYPDYTGLADQTVEHQGDLRAIEGTEVLLHATTNTDIAPGTAAIDLGCTGRRSVRMTSLGRAADGRFTLRLTSDEPPRAEYDSYQLRFSDAEKRENPQPIRYRIEVIRDLPPEVQIVEPRLQESSVAEDGRLAIDLRAEDSDFALRRVGLRAECNRRDVPLAPLLDRKSDEKPWTGEFRETYSFEPSRLGLKAGDRVRIWAEADDNKEPAANSSASAKQWIVVVGPEGRKSPDDQNANADNKSGETKQAGKKQGEQQEEQQERNGQQANGEEGKQQKDNKQQGNQQDGKQQQGQQGEGNQGGKQQDKNQEQGGKQQEGKQQGDQQKGGKQDGGQQGGEQRDLQDGKGKEGAEQQQGDGSQQGNQAGEQSDKRVDPEAQQGDAIQEILKDRENQQKEQPDSDGSKSGEQKQGGQQQPSSDASQGEKQQSTGEQKPNADEQQKGSQEKKEGEQPGSEKANGEKASGEKPGGEKASGEKPGGENAGENPSGEAKPGQEKPEGQQPGSKKAGEANGEKADMKAAGEKGGEKPTGESKAGEEKKEGQASGHETSNEETARGEKAAGGKPGEKPADGVKPSEKPTPGGEAADRAAEKNSAEGQAEENAKRPDDKGEASQKPSGETSTEKQSNTKEPSTEQGAPSKNPKDGGTANGSTKEPPNARGSSLPTTGGKPDEKKAVKPPEPVESSADEANINYARRQTELALEHLRDQMAKDKPGLLDRLGWTKDEAERFLERWEAMKHSAAEPGAKGADAKRQLDDALRSLGLRPRGVELRHGGATKEQPQNLRDAGKFAPPPEWADQLRAYTRGVAGGEKKKE